MKRQEPKSSGSHNGISICFYWTECSRGHVRESEDLVVYMQQTVRASCWEQTLEGVGVKIPPVWDHTVSRQKEGDGVSRVSEQLGVGERTLEGLRSGRWFTGSGRASQFWRVKVGSTC